MDDYFSFKTVGQLRNFLNSMPLKEEIYFYDGDSVYDLEITALPEEKKIISHNGKKYTYKGLFIEVDG